VLASDAGTANQWRLVPAKSGCYHLVNLNSGKVLDNPGGLTEKGRQMRQWTLKAGLASESWCFTHNGAGQYSVRNLSSQLLLDVRSGGAADGTPIQQWSGNPGASGPNQRWRLIKI
jgi:hypothetical protein